MVSLSIAIEPTVFELPPSALAIKKPDELTKLFYIAYAGNYYFASLKYLHDHRGDPSQSEKSYPCCIKMAKISGWIVGVRVGVGAWLLEILETCAPKRSAHPELYLCIKMADRDFCRILDDQEIYTNHIGRPGGNNCR